MTRISVYNRPGVIPDFKSREDLSHSQNFPAAVVLETADREVVAGRSGDPQRCQRFAQLGFIRMVFQHVNVYRACTGLKNPFAGTRSVSFAADAQIRGVCFHGKRVGYGPTFRDIAIRHQPAVGCAALDDQTREQADNNPRG